MSSKDQDGLPLSLDIPLNLSETGRATLKVIEQWMLEGTASHVNQARAEEELGLSLEQFKRLEALVLHIWCEAGVNVENFSAQRNLHRARYTDIYRRALEAGRLTIALRALDSLGRLDGLDAPQQIDINVGRIPITSEARSNVVTLLEKMKALSAARKKGLPSPPNGTNGTNGSNGHGKNGIPKYVDGDVVYDIDEDEDE